MIMEARSKTVFFQRLYHYIQKCKQATEQTTKMNK